MIDTLLSLLGWIVPGAGVVGVWGVVLKIAARFGLGWLTATATGPIGSLVASLSEGLVDLIAWAVKGVLGYAGAWIAGGFDHITKDARSFAILWAVAWAAYAWGGYGRPAPEPPPAPAASPGKAVSKPSGKSTPKPVADDPFRWIDKALKGKW